jgi:hypothetical protein
LSGSFGTAVSRAGAASQSVVVIRMDRFPSSPPASHKTLMEGCCRRIDRCWKWGKWQRSSVQWAARQVAGHGQNGLPSFCAFWSGSPRGAWCFLVVGVWDRNLHFLTHQVQVGFPLGASRVIRGPHHPPGPGATAAVIPRAKREVWPALIGFSLAA